jgi:predicted dehydrogenase
MNSKIRIGILGCAQIAKRSMIPALLSMSDKFQVIAIASRTINKAKEFADLFNIEPIEGYENLLKRKDIDAIYMPLPTGLHKEWLIKAINYEKHIYVEKSFASSFNDCQEIISLAQKKECALMEGYMFQYHSQHKKVFEILSDNQIGEIRSFNASFGFPPLPQNNFRYDDKIGGGALMDAAGYVVRAAFFVLGDQLKVKAASVHYDKNSGTSLWGNAFMKTNDGVAALLSFGFDNFYQCCYQVWASKGKLLLKKAFTPKADEKTILILETNQGVQEILLDCDNHFVKALLEFYEIIQNKNARQKHFNDILIQTKALDDIALFSKRQETQSCS